MKLIAIVISLFLFSCNGQKKATLNDETAQTTMENEQRLELLLVEENSSFDAREIMVFKDDKRLKSFYSKINLTRKPRIPLPIIDFTKEMVVVYCSGLQPQNSALTLKFLEETGSEIILTQFSDGNEKSKNQNIEASPFCVYKMPISEKKVVVDTKMKK